MPELPEVETVRKSLIPKIVNKKVNSVEISNVVAEAKKIGKEAIIKGQSVNDFIELTKDISIKEIKRRGKYLFFILERDNLPFYLVNHLGMSGAWFVVNNIDEIKEAKYKRNIHAIFTLDSKELLVYSDQRRFGELRTIDENSFLSFKPIQKMGPEPLEDGSVDIFIDNVTKLKNKNRTIKDVVLDQYIIAGVGNIYVCESLFLAEIKPQTKILNISTEQLKNVFNHTKDLLEYSLSVGGASISDYVDAEGKKGSFQDTVNVYGRKTCRKCDGKVENVKIKNRSSFYCPKCQTH